MLRYFFATILLFPLYALAQDTLFYDTLIRSEYGDYLTVTSVSEVTGLEEEYCLKKGTWDYYGVGGELYKRSRHKPNERSKSTVYDGLTTYYDSEGEKLLEVVYNNGEVQEYLGFREVIIIEGPVMLNIVKQYGELKVFEHTNRFKIPKIVSEYINLRASNELRYYESTEERLASPHLLDTAKYWPNRDDNLISNPMFEDHPKLPTSKASVRDGEVKHWTPISPTPDFYYSEDCKSGTGCMGFRVYSLMKDIEYLQNKLAGKLKKDSLYCFSLYVKLANQCAYTSNGLGVHFSKKPIEDLDEVIGKQPNLLLNENYLPYKTKWMMLQCRYRAIGNEKYVTIGSFKKLSDIALTSVNGQSAEAYYIIDDVSLVPISDSTECKCNLDVEPVYPPATVYDTLKQDTGFFGNPRSGDKLVLENVYFDNDKAELLPESIETLLRLRNMLYRYPEIELIISGHTSSVGDYDHNVQLSWKRAKAVRSFLILQGISPDRVRSEGKGPDNPIASNNAPEGQARNRRVEVEVK